MDSLFCEDYMDDGTVIKLKLTINRETRSAIFDFTGNNYKKILFGKKFNLFYNFK